jgi:hypothetical protein
MSRPIRGNAAACKGGDDGAATRPLARFALADQTLEQAPHPAEVGQPLLDDRKFLLRKQARFAAASTVFELQQGLYFVQCEAELLCALDESQPIRPKAGDCCVFCSYGSTRCPPVQLRERNCRSG